MQVVHYYGRLFYFESYPDLPEIKKKWRMTVAVILHSSYKSGLTVRNRRK